MRVDNRATDAAHVLARIFLERGEHRKAIRFAKLALKRPGGRERPENFIVGARSFAALGQFTEARGSVKSLAALPGQEAAAVVEGAAIERLESGSEAACTVILGSGLASLTGAS